MVVQVQYTAIVLAVRFRGGKREVQRVDVIQNG